MGIKYRTRVKLKRKASYLKRRRDRLKEAVKALKAAKAS